jgi:hypothetical protein
MLIQGVSEFHRQTFRADSMIKNKHKKLLIQMGLKTLSLRDNRLKSFTSNKSNKLSKFRPLAPRSMHR